MKSLIIALIMAVVLFAYGYVLSTAGHDHSSHSKSTPLEAESWHDHHDHAH